MEMEGLDEVYRLQRFLPTREEAVGYFLPRLLTGETLHGAEKLIYHDDIYAREPKDLAAAYPPVPTAVSTGDRFFLTTCRHNRSGHFARIAGAGTWTVQKTEDVYDDEGVKIGEARTVSFKINKKSTGWVMEEYRCLLPQAIVAEGEKMLCRIHLAANPPPAARQESDAYKLRRQQGAEQAPAPQPAELVNVTASAHAHKRPAPVAAADQSSCKKMRIAAPVPEAEVEYEDCPMWFTPAASAPVAAPVPVPGAEVEYKDCPMWYTPAASDYLQEWPAPVAAADPPCSNQMYWMSAPVPVLEAEVDYEDCPVWFTPTASRDLEERPAPVAAAVSAPAPASDEEEYEDCTLPAESTEALESDDDTGRLSCSWEELLGEEEEEGLVEAESNIQQPEAPIDWDKVHQLLSAPIVDINQLEKMVSFEAYLAHLREAAAAELEKKGYSFAAVS